MNVRYFKYNQKVGQQWLLYVGLVFNVFAFSGFNDKIEYAFHEHTQTELVDSRSIEADLSLNYFSNEYAPVKAIRQWLYLDSFGAAATAHFKTYLFTKFKSVLREALVRNTYSIRHLIKRPVCSSSEENLHYIVG